MSDHSKGSSKRLRHEYTSEDDNAILEAVSLHGATEGLKGNAFWRRLANEQTAGPHTYQSLKNRFLKKLATPAKQPEQLLAKHKKRKVMELARDNDDQEEEQQEEDAQEDLEEAEEQEEIVVLRHGRAPSKRQARESFSTHLQLDHLEKKREDEDGFAEEEQMPAILARKNMAMEALISACIEYTESISALLSAAARQYPQSSKSSARCPSTEPARTLAKTVYRSSPSVRAAPTQFAEHPPHRTKSAKTGPSGFMSPIRGLPEARTLPAVTRPPLGKQRPHLV